MNKTSKASQQLKVVQIIYGALIMGVVLLSAFLFYTLETPFFKFDKNDLYTIVVPVVGICGVFVSLMVYKRLLLKITAKDNLHHKLAKFQSATIVKGALIEGPALFSSFMVTQTNNLLFYIYTAVLVIVMYLLFPTKQRFKKDVTLRLNEKSEFDKF